MTVPHELAEDLVALRADNARLRRLLDEAGVHDGLRHAFRDTLALMRAILRRSVESADDVESYAAHLEGRLDAIGRVRMTLDAFGEADLHALISDALLVHLVREGEQAGLDGPTVQLRPRAAQMVALAMHELASNAVEHGSLNGPGGQVHVGWRVEAGEADPVVALVWKETGSTGVVEAARRGFGRVMLEETLAYEFDARTALAFEPDGLRCTIRIPLTAQVGRLATSAGAQDDDDGE